MSNTSITVIYHGMSLKMIWGMEHTGTQETLTNFNVSIGIK
jgi:hypothetical protein